MQTSVPREDLEHILDHTRSLWEPLRNETLFITGGTGFFGKWLLESLAFVNSTLDLGIQAVVLTRNLDAFSKAAPHLSCNPALRFVQGDVRTFHADGIRTQLGKAAPERYSHVIHAATEVSATLHTQNPSETMDTIVEGTRAVLDFAVASQARRFLFTSSGAVYGRQPADIVHLAEDDLDGRGCTHPDSAYGEAKKLAEMLCVSYHQQHGLEPLLARCFAFVGPHLPLDGAFAIGNFIRDALEGKQITVKGDGTPCRSYLYAADLAIWLWTILLKGQPCTPYNVGSEESISIRHLAEMVAESLAPGAKVVIEKSSNLNAPASRYVPSTARARNELGLKTWISLEESIRRTAQWNQSTSAETLTCAKIKE